MTYELSVIFARIAIVGSTHMILYYGNTSLEDKLNSELEALLIELNDTDVSGITFENMLLDHDQQSLVLKPQNNDFNSCFDAYVRRLSESKSVQQAKEIEARLTTIESYPLAKIKVKSKKVASYFKFKAPSVTAVIDWLALEFRVNASAFVFKHPDKPFQDIRKLMKDHAVDPNMYVLHSKSDRSKFTIHLHDIARVEQLDRVIELLRVHYGASPHEMRITTLELSLDFWHVKTKAMLLALAKSVRAVASVEDKDFRVYLDTNHFAVMPKDPCKAMSYIDQGYTIGIGHMRNDDVYIRAYYKRTDRNADLPEHERRLRIEVNLTGKILEVMGNHTDNLKALIEQGFKHLTFTRLNTDVANKDQVRYTDQVELFGRSTSVISRSRNRRPLCNFIRTNRGLNDVVRKSVYNLSRYF